MNASVGASVSSFQIGGFDVVVAEFDSPCNALRNASMNSDGVWKRWSGNFAVARAHQASKALGKLGTKEQGGVTGSWQICENKVITLLEW